jgi:hypothetical protein
MASQSSNKDIKKVNCYICGDTVKPNCDYRQGRCPHRHPVDFKLLFKELKEKFMKQPDPKLHFQISMLKSLIRISAGIGLLTGNLLVAGALLIGAELLGIVEELV